MSFTQSIKTCFQKYVDFSGRGSRSEYWWFFLFAFIVRVLTVWIPFVGFIVFLGLLLPSLAATARRLHDTNRTGWWMMLPIGLGILGLALTPVLGGIGFLGGDELGFVGGLLLGIALSYLLFFVGFLIILVFLVQPSDSGPNKYGPSPQYPQQNMNPYPYNQAPSNPYSSQPPPANYSQPTYDPSPPNTRSEPEPNQRRFCTQCGAQLQADARFCTTCGASA